MKLRPASLFTALFFAYIAQPVLPAAANTVRETLVAGTQVPVHVVASISSANANPGDTFTFVAAKDVVVDGRVVVKAGAQGQGRIVSVTKARGSGHSGALGIKYDWIYAADGGKIHLSDVADAKTEEDRKGASSTATIIGIATFGIGGLFGHNFAHGKDLTIDENKTLTAFVASTVHVETHETEPSGDAGFDH